MHVIPLGPYHPTLEEPVLYKLYVEDEIVKDIEIRIGYSHRGVEFLAEKKTFEQVPFILERVCGICSNSHPMAFCQAVEELAEIEVPERALYIRTILAELERLHSHLLWLGLLGHILGYQTLFMRSFRYREPILDILERITGSRTNYGIHKIGGLRRDFDERDLNISHFLEQLAHAQETFARVILSDPLMKKRLNIGKLRKNDALKNAVVGPVARASGIPIDIRKDDPHAAYDKIKFNVVVRDEGTVLEKLIVRLNEIQESVNIVKQCIEELPEGPVAVKVENIPKGEGIGRVEAPRGELFYYVRADGSNVPARVKISTPTYSNLPSFKSQVIGEDISDISVILTGLDPCFSCTDRITVIENKREKNINLVKLSQNKTKLMRKNV